MKFSTEQVVASPCEDVFAALTDFARFEREARAHGAEIHRTDTLTRPGQGMKWRAKFETRGRERELFAEVARMNDPRDLYFVGKIGGMEGELEFILTPNGDHETKLAVELNLRARSITAKLLLQSLKLARSNVAKRFRRRVKAFCRETEKQVAYA